jgi:hypothetical protein
MIGNLQLYLPFVFHFPLSKKEKKPNCFYFRHSIAWPFSVVDTMNRGLMSTFAYEYMYHRYTTTEPIQRGVKQWPPRAIDDGCCRQCIDKPLPLGSSIQRCTITDATRGGCSTPPQGAQQCNDGGSTRFAVPIPGFPQCSFAHHYFFRESERLAVVRHAFKQSVLVWMDCDNDQFLDVVLQCNGQPPSVWMNDGTGQYTHTGLLMPSMSSNVLSGADVADVDEDGLLDIVGAVVDKGVFAFISDVQFHHCLNVKRHSY